MGRSHSSAVMLCLVAAEDRSANAAMQGYHYTHTHSCTCTSVSIRVRPFTRALFTPSHNYTSHTAHLFTHASLFTPTHMYTFTHTPFTHIAPCSPSHCTFYTCTPSHYTHTLSYPHRRERVIEEPEVIYEASDESDQEQRRQPVHRIIESDSER